MRRNQLSPCLGRSQLSCCWVPGGVGGLSSVSTRCFCEVNIWTYTSHCTVFDAKHRHNRPPCSSNFRWFRAAGGRGIRLGEYYGMNTHAYTSDRSRFYAPDTAEVHCHVPGRSQLSCCRYQEEGEESISVSTRPFHKLDICTYFLTRQTPPMLTAAFFKLSLISCCRYQEEGQESILVSTRPFHEVNTRTYTSDCSVFDTVDCRVSSRTFAAFVLQVPGGVGSSSCMSVQLFHKLDICTHM